MPYKANEVLFDDDIVVALVAKAPSEQLSVKLMVRVPETLEPEMVAQLRDSLTDFLYENGYDD